ncbi:hypothetical protein G7Y79_00037g073230 [Physcia stellaris]|nr:hypothetical protein G7Y79_00037g073230 [Physcia stellaris]
MTPPSPPAATPQKAAAEAPSLKRKRSGYTGAARAAAAMQAFAEHGITPNVFIGNQVNLPPKQPILNQQKPKQSEKAKWSEAQFHFDQQLPHSGDRSNADSDNFRKELCRRFSRRDPEKDAELVLQLLGELFLTRYPAPPS